MDLSTCMKRGSGFSLVWPVYKGIESCQVHASEYGVAPSSTTWTNIWMNAVFCFVRDMAQACYREAAIFMQWQNPSTSHQQGLAGQFDVELWWTSLQVLGCNAMHH
jgi:hypothetical protein